ncbi:LytR/AlgR family response regulator transcription factor [Fervidobacterium sp.]
MFTCGIVEDESMSMERIKRLLNEIDSDIKILFEAFNCEEFVKKVNLFQPDVLFLDINVGDKLIFDVLGSIEYEPHIVFVTAYDEYTLKAFEEGAIDYVLKPISKERLSKTIERLIKLGLKKQKPEYYLSQLSKLPVKYGEEIYLLDTNDIIYLEADNKIVHIVTKEKVFECVMPLHTLLTKLPSKDFIQVHKSYIISIKNISKIKKWFQNTYIVLMNNGAEIRVSRSYQNNFFKILGLKE